MSFNQFVEFPDLIPPSSGADCCSKAAQVEISTHEGSRPADGDVSQFYTKWPGQRPLAMQGVYIPGLLNQLKICKGTADRLLLIYCYLELMGSVKFHDGQMNTVCLCRAWEQRRPESEVAGSWVLSPSVAF